MKNILKEIHSQPRLIRDTFMWLCIITVVSLLGFFWLRNMQQNIVALVNPDNFNSTNNTDESKALAQAPSDRSPSPFKTLYNSWSELRANISEFSNFRNNSVTITNIKEKIINDFLPPRELPLSSDKIKSIK